MTRATFLAYLEQCLAPTLRHVDIIIIGNLPAHKGIAVHKAIAAARAKLLCLPKYSPDGNLIEQVFSKLKALGQAFAVPIDKSLGQIPACSSTARRSTGMRSGSS
ncbi:MAG: transposase [Xanthobacteraceae bacterium]|jgi:transposase